MESTRLFLRERERERERERLGCSNVDVFKLKIQFTYN